jgi:simple sugar transport system ATP-binding protein
MVGRELVGLSRRTAAPTGATVLTMTGVMALNGQGAPALRGLDLTVRAGEIVGVAGVSGNGQVELAQVLDGTRTITGGTVTVNSAPVVTASVTAGPAEMMAAGIGRIPEDRHASVVGEMSVAQNLALEHLHEFTRGGRLDHRAIRRHAETLIAAYQIKAQPDDRIRTLSGGNIQKCILARVIERNPQLIVVAQPTRGLDIGATEYVRNKLLEQRQRGAAILLFSEDLEELLELADRIAVIYDGRILADMPVAAATTERLGLLMAGIT